MHRINDVQISLVAGALAPVFIFGKSGMMHGMRRVIGVFVALQVASFAIYRFAAEFGDYGELWPSIPVLHLIPFAFAQVLFVICAEVVLISSMAWLWYRRRKPMNPSELAVAPEHERLERKSTLRWDLKTGAVNKSLERAAIKTVAAFMNSKGGNLVLGVGDRGEAVGLEHDFATLPRGDADGLQNHFSNMLSAMLGPSLRHYVKLRPFTHEGKTCMLVSVAPADRPAYLREQDHEEFFIRTGNGTTSLRISEANAYITSRFGTKS